MFLFVFHLNFVKRVKRSDRIYPGYLIFSQTQKSAILTGLRRLVLVYTVFTHICLTIYGSMWTLYIMGMKGQACI